MLRRRIEAHPERVTRVRRRAWAFAISLISMAPAARTTRAGEDAPPVAGDPGPTRWSPAAPAWPAEFVDLSAVAPGIAVQMRYAGRYNFVGRPVRGYAAPRCLLTRPAAAALARQGLGLMVYDCYRPQRAVADFLAWSGDDDVSTRERHYPSIPKAQLFGLGYIAAHSGHSRGSTVDLTLVRLPRVTGDVAAALPAQAAPQVEPDDCRHAAPPAGDDRLDMGTAFDCFDDRAHADYPGLSPAVRRHRRVLRHAMLRRGFLPYAKEWWHFTLAVEPFPQRAFDFEIR